MEKTHTKLRIAAVGDIHIKAESQDLGFENLEQLNETADILLLCGDLTNTGTEEEASNLVKILSRLHIPVAGVFGNHDYANEKGDEVRKILSEGNMHFLDTTPFEIDNVGIVGVKGFGGGFENHMLNAFGEKTLKEFVYEAINESLKLENLLAQLQTPKKIVISHYSPIKATCVGEPEEIFPFLGSSHMVEPINNFDVDMCFHGHAHFGSFEGKTIKEIPVFNVSLPVLKKLNPESPIRIFEL